MRYDYFIIEHPTRGVLRDLEETDTGNVGRFSLDGLRGSDNCERFYSIVEARRARERITPVSRATACQVLRSSDWRVVA